MDSTATNEIQSFLDAYSGYHQINMNVDANEETAFITLFSIFCYTKLSFSLKNVGATYQKCTDFVLEDQIR
jgi:hypothetical protein